jgi:hypothetical protein
VKVFNLKCDANHPFEGWFDSLEAFHDQQSQGLLECPLCASRVVEKMLSAPRLNLSGAKAPPQLLPAGSAASALAPASANALGALSASGADQGPAAMSLGIPPSVLPAVLQAMRQIVAQSEDVGDRFADEARAMHAQEIPARAIVGQTTLETAKELAEEGIPVMPLPFGHLLKSPLQ